MSTQPASSSGGSRSVPAEWTTVPGDLEATRQLLGRRIAYFAKVFCLLSAAFYLRNALAIALLEHDWPPLGAAPFMLHLAALGVHAIAWASCRGGVRSLRQLRAIDAAGLIGAMALYGGVTIAEASSFEHAVAVQSAGAEVFLVALIMLGITLTHAIIVPLDVRAMLAVSAASGAVGVAAAYVVSLVGLPAELLAAKPWLSWAGPSRS